MVLRRRERARVRIEIIPMIDVVFFLLVFFMMASLSMAIYQGLPVNLPRAATSRETAAKSASVTVDRDGRTFVNREPVPVPALVGHLQALLRRDPSLAIIVNADGDVTHRHVVDVLDALRVAGVSRMAIAVMPADRTQPSARP